MQPPTAAPLCSAAFRAPPPPPTSSSSTLLSSPLPPPSSLSSLHPPPSAEEMADTDRADSGGVTLQSEHLGSKMPFQKVFTFSAFLTLCLPPYTDLKCQQRVLVHHHQTVWSLRQCHGWDDWRLQWTLVPLMVTGAKAPRSHWHKSTGGVNQGRPRSRNEPRIITRLLNLHWPEEANWMLEGAEAAASTGSTASSFNCFH